MPNNVKRILADLVEYGGERITGINDATRQAVKAQLAEGVRRGYSINQLIEGVANEGYAGVANAVLDNGVPAFDPYRAEVISRTETALSFNRAAITGYREFGVREVQAIDGDGDPDCANRDGQVFPVDEALGIEDHPNGTLDWVPVIGDKASRIVLEPSFKVQPHITINQGATTVEPAAITVQPAPVQTVTVKSPDVNVTNTPSVVNVAAPNVTVEPTFNVPAAKVSVEIPTVNVDIPDGAVQVKMPDSFAITSMPMRKTERRVKRNSAGGIESTTDVEMDA
jgi:hypothetical protein